MPSLSTLTLTKKEKIELKIEEVREEIENLENKLDVIAAIATKNDGLTYPSVSIDEHFQLHLKELNQLTQIGANDEDEIRNEREQEKIA